MPYGSVRARQGWHHEKVGVGAGVGVASACTVHHKRSDVATGHGGIMGWVEGGWGNTAAVILPSRWAQRAPEQREAVFHRPQRVGRKVARPYGSPRPAGLQQQVRAVQPASLPYVLRVVQVEANGARKTAVRRVHHRYDGRACVTWRVGWWVEDKGEGTRGWCDWDGCKDWEPGELSYCTGTLLRCMCVHHSHQPIPLQIRTPLPPTLRTHAVTRPAP